MDVIPKETVRVASNLAALAGFCEEPEILLMISVIKKDWAPVVAPGHYVIEHSRNVKTEWTCHGHGVSKVDATDILCKCIGC